MLNDQNNSYSLESFLESIRSDNFLSKKEEILFESGSEREKSEDSI